MTRRNFFQVLAAGIGSLFALPSLAKKTPEPVVKRIVVVGDSIQFDSAAFGTDACRPGVDTHYYDAVHPTNEGILPIANELALHVEHAQLIQLEPVSAFVRMTA